MISSSDALPPGFPSPESRDPQGLFVLSWSSEMVPLEGLRSVVREAPDAGTERQGLLWLSGDNLLFLCSSVLFLQSAPELGSSTQLLLNFLCSITSLPRIVLDHTLVSEPRVQILGPQLNHFPFWGFCAHTSKAGIVFILM